MLLTKQEQKYLLRLVYADLQRMNNLADHAIAHGAELVLPDHSKAESISNYLIHDLLQPQESNDAG